MFQNQFLQQHDFILVIAKYVYPVEAVHIFVYSSLLYLNFSVFIQ